MGHAKNEWRKFLVCLFGIIVTMGTSILVMIHGWGLQPKNWWWIVPIYLFGCVLGLAISKLGFEEDK